MIIFNRKEAATLASFFKFLSLSIEERTDKIEAALIELELEDVSFEESNFQGRKSIEEEFETYTNTYIQQYLSKKLDQEIIVKGAEPTLFACPCCQFKTLERRGEYFICKVCFWEDDFTNIDSQFSTVNGMTLIEGKNNFDKFGVVEEKFLKYVEYDRMTQYIKNEGRD